MKGRGTELYLFAVQLRNVIVFPNFPFFLIEILHFGFRFHIEKIYIDHGPREKRHHDHLLHRGLGCVYGLYE